MSTNWADHYSERSTRIKSSAIREILKITQMPGVISFAGGLPAPDLFPVERVEAATQAVLKKNPVGALQYGLTEGYLPLRKMVAGMIQEQGIACDASNVLITSGSQQALDLIGKLFIDEGQKILVEAPTYLGAIGAWKPYGAEYIQVPSDENGMQVETIDDAVFEQHPGMLYVVPTFQNPSGTTMTRDRRERLVRMANERGLPVIEDDPYGELRYEGEVQPSLLELDAKQRTDHAEAFSAGNVIYLSTFSKTLCPGFRVAWVVAPTEVIGKLAQTKQGTDLQTSSFTQMVAHELASDGFLEQHIDVLRAAYRMRRDQMLDLLDEFFAPLGVTWNHPQGGLFIWARLPEGVNTTELLPKAIEKKVAYVPGAPFFPKGGGENTLRLNFSNATPEQLEQGMARLTEVFRKELG